MSWTVLLATNETTSKSFTVNIESYSFLSVELWFGSNCIISQIILPKANCNYFRSISGFIDSSSNIAIGYLVFTSNTSVNAYINKQVNTNGIYIRLRGIKNTL